MWVFGVRNEGRELNASVNDAPVQMSLLKTNDNAKRPWSRNVWREEVARQLGSEASWHQRRGGSKGPERLSRGCCCCSSVASVSHDDAGFKARRLARAAGSGRLFRGGFGVKLGVTVGCSEVAVGDYSDHPAEDVWRRHPKRLVQPLTARTNHWLVDCMVTYLDVFIESSRI